MGTAGSGKDRGMAGRLTACITAAVLLSGCAQKDTGVYTMADIESWQKLEEVTMENKDDYIVYAEESYAYTASDTEGHSTGHIHDHEAVYTGEEGEIINSGVRYLAELRGDYIVSEDPVRMDVRVSYIYTEEYVDADTLETREEIQQENRSVQKQIIPGAEGGNILCELDNYSEPMERTDQDGNAYTARFHSHGEITEIDVTSVSGYALLWQIPDTAWQESDGRRAILISEKEYDAVLYEDGMTRRTDKKTGEVRSILTNPENGSFLDWNLHWVETGSIK